MNPITSFKAYAILVPVNAYLYDSIIDWGERIPGMRCLKFHLLREDGNMPSLAGIYVQSTLRMIEDFDDIIHEACPRLTSEEKEELDRAFALFSHDEDLSPAWHQFD